MPLFDFLKNKKKLKEKEVKEKEVKETKKKRPEKKEEIKPLETKVKESPKRKEIIETRPVLKNPHISEKATDLSKENQYIFEIYPSTNKTEIKKAVENIYKVDVLSVNIIKIPPKKKRFRGKIGFKGGYKKAIVKIKEGQKIEILF